MPPMHLRVIGLHLVFRAARSTVLPLLAALALGCDDKRSTLTPSPIPADGIESAYAQARAEANIKSLVLARNGSILRAEYFNGGGADTPEPVWSVTKSVLALGVGAALDAGCLSSTDQTIGELLGSTLVPDKAKAAITLEHLLTMSSGIDFPEAASYAAGPSLYDAWIGSPDQVAFVVGRPLTAQPGSRFEYGSGTIHLASVALTRACGSSTSAFVQNRVFAALGIPARAWDVDHQGYTNGGAGLSLSPTDMVAIGEMVRNQGLYRGQRVVSAGWVQAMTGIQIATAPGSATGAYGYGWWVGQTRRGDTFQMAHGWGGQFILVVPARGLVVTTAASAAGLSGSAAMAQWERLFDIVYSRLLPAF